MPELGQQRNFDGNRTRETQGEQGHDEGTGTGNPEVQRQNTQSLINRMTQGGGEQRDEQKIRTVELASRELFRSMTEGGFPRGIGVGVLRASADKLREMCDYPLRVLSRGSFGSVAIPEAGAMAERFVGATVSLMRAAAGLGTQEVSPELVELHRKTAKHSDKLIERRNKAGVLQQRTGGGPLGSKGVKKSFEKMRLRSTVTKARESQRKFEHYEQQFTPAKEEYRARIRQQVVALPDHAAANEALGELRRFCDGLGARQAFAEDYLGGIVSHVVKCLGDPQIHAMGERDRPGQIDLENIDNGDEETDVGGEGGDGEE